MTTAPKISEADLCSDFMLSLPENWTPYPETAGFDILLVEKASGMQIGVEAKLKLNAKVVNQIIENRYAVTAPGPDFRAVLVPETTNHELAAICDFVGITVIGVRTYENSWSKNRTVYFNPCLPDVGAGRYTSSTWHHMAPVQRCALPDFVPDVLADGWLGISEAPQDGTEIDLWVSCGVRIPDCRWGAPSRANWGDRFGCDKGLPKQWVTRDGYALDRRNGEPTHFMLKPKGPGSLDRAAQAEREG